jgi:CRP/FNR family cyclic AMP-dependent transcriptional regulator
MPDRSDEAIASLRALPLFSEVAEEDLRRLAGHLIERRFPRDATLIQEGQPGDYMYVLREGRVKVTKLSGAGREKILEILTEGAFFGEMALLDPPDRSASVKSLDPVRVLALSRHGFLQALERSPGLAMAVIRELSRRLRHTNLEASHIPYQSVKERTQELLSRLATETDAEGWRVSPPLTHQEVADMVATSRETVTRAVKQLKQEGWLRQEGKRYRIRPDA